MPVVNEQITEEEKAALLTVVEHLLKPREMELDVKGITVLMQHYPGIVKKAAYAIKRIIGEG